MFRSPLLSPLRVQGGWLGFGRQGFRDHQGLAAWRALRTGDHGAEELP